MGLFEPAQKLTLWVLDALDRTAQWHLRAIYRKVPTSAVPGDDHVHVVFHTYYGLLTHVVQREHDCYVPLQRAKELLRRLHAFNLLHGFLTVNAPVLAIASRLEYWRQLREIRARLRDK
jgi:hypothetical protein